MTQGVYRIVRDADVLLESFVAAPGPAGWRYFGRVREAGSERELYALDHVTDSEWRLVRCRLLGRGLELTVERSAGGLHVIGPEKVTEFDGAELAWTPSPWSLHVLQQYLWTRGTAAAEAVRVSAQEPAVLVRVELRREPGAAVGVVAVDGRPTEVHFGTELPERGDGWFELVR